MSSETKSIKNINIEELVEVITHTMKNGLTVVVTGAPGIGKTVVTSEKVVEINENEKLKAKEYAQQEFIFAETKDKKQEIAELTQWIDRNPIQYILIAERLYQKGDVICGIPDINEINKCIEWYSSEWFFNINKRYIEEIEKAIFRRLEYYSIKLQKKQIEEETFINRVKPYKHAIKVLTIFNNKKAKNILKKVYNEKSYEEEIVSYKTKITINELKLKKLEGEFTPENEEKIAKSIEKIIGHIEEYKHAIADIKNKIKLEEIDYHKTLKSLIKNKTIYDYEIRIKMVVILDDLHLLKEYQAHPLYQFLEEQRLNNNELMKKTAVIILGNYDQEQVSGTLLESPIMSRIYGYYKLLPKNSELGQWFINDCKWNKTGLNKTVGAFLMAYSEYSTTEDPEIMTTYPCGRSWEKFVESVDKIEGISQHNLVKTIKTHPSADPTAIVGMRAGSLFMDAMKFIDKSDDVLLEPTNHMQENIVKCIFYLNKSKSKVDALTNIINIYENEDGGEELIVLALKASKNYLKNEEIVEGSPAAKKVLLNKISKYIKVMTKY